MSDSAQQFWQQMHGRPRRRARTIQRHTLPREPGAYAWYRGVDPIYVGKAEDLRARVWGQHLSRAPSLGNSAFRRNAAEHLGIAPAAEITSGAYKATAEDLKRIRGFIEDCELAWLVTATPDDAVALEAALTSEWKPPLPSMFER